MARGLTAALRAGTIAGGALIAAIGWSSPALASGDDGCDTAYTTNLHIYRPCNNLMVIAPGTDTRISMWMLFMDQKGDRRMPRPNDAAVPLTNWTNVMAGLLPPPDPNARYTVRGTATLCDSDASGAPAFIAAVNAARGIPAAEKQALVAARETLSAYCRTKTIRRNDCPSWRRDEPQCQTALVPPTPVSASSAEGREFAAYLNGANGFYQSEFDSALQAFSSQTRARNAWVKEAAIYMVARTALNEAQTTTFNDWGDFDPQKAVNAPRANEIEGFFNAYINSYRSGRYAASAKGLMRRLYWISGQTQKLAALYDEAAADGGRDPVALSSEIDLKLFAGQNSNYTLSNPILLAIRALSQMRSEDFSTPHYTPITRAQVDALRPHFAGQDALFDFVVANHDFYVAHQPRAVLQRIAANPRATRFSNLEFSRQMLRGQALDATRDAGAAAHWQGMLTGASDGYQRLTVELALAQHYEKAGNVAPVFAANSPIQSAKMREILLMNAAQPALLEQVARNTQSTPRERSVAAFTLLYKRLSRGEYAEFGRELAVIPSNAAPSADNGRYWLWGTDPAPVAIFRSTKSDAGYACPAMPQIAQQLVANPRNIRASMCLGEFTRLAGFDSVPIDQQWFPDSPRNNGVEGLGSERPAFGIGDYNRMAIYQRVIADRTASADDRAYALYRAVNCYAPSGANACGPQEIPQTQRRAWFNQLKQQYAQSRWARELRYYW